MGEAPVTHSEGVSGPLQDPEGAEARGVEQGLGLGDAAAGGEGGEVRVGAAGPPRGGAPSTRSSMPHARSHSAWAMSTVGGRTSASWSTATSQVTSWRRGRRAARRPGRGPVGAEPLRRRAGGQVGGGGGVVDRHRAAAGLGHRQGVAQPGAGRRLERDPAPSAAAGASGRAGGAARRPGAPSARPGRPPSPARRGRGRPGPRTRRRSRRSARPKGRLSSSSLASTTAGPGHAGQVGQAHADRARSAPRDRASVSGSTGAKARAGSSSRRRSRRRRRWAADRSTST